MSNNSVTYFIPGMGANEQMFYRQRSLPFDKEFLSWIDPLKGENIQDYAARYLPLLQQDRPINIVGVSFGGVLAIEISKHLPVNKLILISSVRSRKDMPLIMKILRYIPLYKLMPPRKPPMNRKFISKLFGISKETDLDAFIEMIEKFDFRYIKWGIGQLINWKQNEPVENAIGIIGDSDRLFSSRVEGDIVINGGTHYMIVERSSEINELLKRLINE